MGETGDVLFGRSVFGGFNRRDVMDYIDRLQRAAVKGDDPLALSLLRRERDALERENLRLREEILQLRAQLKVEQTANEVLDEKLHAADTVETADAAEAADAVEAADAAESVQTPVFAAAEKASDPEPKGLSEKDVDEMVKKYFG